MPARLRRQVGKFVAPMYSHRNAPVKVQGTRVERLNSDELGMHKRTKNNGDYERDVESKIAAVVVTTNEVVMRSAQQRQYRQLDKS